MAKVLPSRRDNMGLVDVKIITTSEKWNMLERLFQEYCADKGLSYNGRLIYFIEKIINEDDKLEERLRNAFGLENDED